MKESFFLASPIAGGFTWTLASRLGDMLTWAQNLFGPRNKEYTVLGIEFSAEGPMIWYPKAAKHIVIQLSLSARQDEVIALYQLSHECVHLLQPSGGEAATVFEEGLAVFFSWWYLEERLGIAKARELTSDPRYREAGELVHKFLLENTTLVEDWLRSGRNLLELDLRDVPGARELTHPFKRYGIPFRHPSL